MDRQQQGAQGVIAGHPAQHLVVKILPSTAVTGGLSLRPGHGASLMPLQAWFVEDSGCFPLASSAHCHLPTGKCT